MVVVNLTDMIRVSVAELLSCHLNRHKHFDIYSLLFIIYLVTGSSDNIANSLLEQFQSARENLLTAEQLQEANEIARVTGDRAKVATMQAWQETKLAGS